MSNEDVLLPRFKVVGDACAACGERQESGEILIKVRAMSNRGYLDTELCRWCLLNWPKQKGELDAKVT